MPIDLVEPIKSVARIKKGFEEDKPQEKPMTEYQKQKIEVAKQSNELKAQKLAKSDEQVKLLAEKESRLKEKQASQQQRLTKESEAKIERDRIKAQVDLQNAKNQGLKEKRLFQNSKNREALLKAQQSLSDDILSKKMTKEGTLKHLGTLKEGPKPVGFQNINPGGGIENE